MVDKFVQDPAPQPWALAYLLDGVVMVRPALACFSHRCWPFPSARAIQQTARLTR